MWQANSSRAHQREPLTAPEVERCSGQEVQTEGRDHHTERRPAGSVSRRRTTASMSGVIRT